jgi:hypothetical protein
MTAQHRIAGALFASFVLLSGSLSSAQATSSQTSSPGQAQGQSSTDQDVELLRKDIRSQKKQMIAANMNLTDKEAEQFWPLYDQYTAELVKINDKKYAAIKQFAQSYDTLTDQQAVDLTSQSLEVDQAVAQLRKRYIPIFQKVLSGKKTALFFQLDRRLVMVIDMQLSSAVPLVQP